MKIFTMLEIVKPRLKVIKSKKYLDLFQLNKSQNLKKIVTPIKYQNT